MDCHQAHHRNLLTVNCTDGLSTGSISSTATVNIETCTCSNEHSQTRAVKRALCEKPAARAPTIDPSAATHHMVHHPPTPNAAAIDLIIPKSLACGVYTLIS